MTTSSGDSASDIPPLEEAGDSFCPATPSTSELDVEDDEAEMRRWTAEAFTPARTTPGRRPLFRS